MHYIGRPGSSNSYPDCCSLFNFPRMGNTSFESETLKQTQKVSHRVRESTYTQINRERSVSILWLSFEDAYVWEVCASSQIRDHIWCKVMSSYTFCFCLPVDFRSFMTTDSWLRVTEYVIIYDYPCQSRRNKKVIIWKVASPFLCRLFVHNKVRLTWNCIFSRDYSSQECLFVVHSLVCGPNVEACTV